MKRMFLMEAVTRRERRETTSAVFDAIVRLGGWVEDSRLYSNIMTVVRFTMRGRDMPALVTELATLGLVVETPQVAADDSECSGTLQLTFLHDEPDLTREVPSVPG